MSSVWENRGSVAWLLLPVSVLFRCLALLRISLFKLGVLKVHDFSVPVIVVGNISVGGTGKTPIVSALAKRCQSVGMKPGIVSRGYGAEPAKLPRMVDSNSPVELSGDEPLQLARDTGVPVCICTDRSVAVKQLIENRDVDVVISDDGMQHYAMSRDIEIAVIDGQKLLSNGWLLPAGPLREPPKRLRQVDIVAVQQAKSAPAALQQEGLAALSSAQRFPPGGHFYLEITAIQNLANQQTVALETLHGKQVHAVAGVGNPSRYFASLREAGVNVIEHAMPDHHRYTTADIAFDDHLPILITSKDAVKIRALSMDLTRIFEVSVRAKFDTDLDQAIDNMITTLI